MDRFVPVMYELLTEQMKEPVSIAGRTFSPINAGGKVTLNEDEDNYDQTTTVWDFPERGRWATHTSNYRGNWSPKVVRNILVKYSQENDLVLDPMVGGGTTLIECAQLNRHGVGIDININAALLCKNKIDAIQNITNGHEQRVFVGDARKMTAIDSEVVDLVLIHPPYWNIIKYSTIKDDISTMDDLSDFFIGIIKIAQESYRVLKPGKYCAVMIGDTHCRAHSIPLSQRLLYEFLRSGYILKESVIKIQHNCSSSHQKYSNNFLMTMHESLYIFRKPNDGLDLKKHHLSSIMMFDGPCPSPE